MNDTLALTGEKLQSTEDTIQMVGFILAGELLVWIF